MGSDKLREVREALLDMLKAYEMLMPGVRHIAVQNYELLNTAPLRARRTLEDVLTEALRIASPATIKAHLDALPPGCCNTCIDGECHGTPEQRTACTALDANEPDPQQPRGERTCGECKHYNTLMGGCRAVARVGPLAVDTDATTCPAFTAREEVARPCSDPAECPDCAHGCEKGERRG